VETPSFVRTYDEFEYLNGLLELTGHYVTVRQIVFGAAGAHSAAPEVGSRFEQILGGCFVSSIQQRYTTSIDLVSSS
jgi:hypothetical protein